MYHALITGAGRGLGRAAALALAADGMELTLLARSRAELEETARAAGGAARVVVADVTDPDAIGRAVAEADAHAPLRVLVAAAGLNRTGPSASYAVADFDHLMAVNVRGTFLAAQAAGRCMLERSAGGRIVLVSSQMGSVGYPGRAAYCATKHAVNGLAKALAVEWAPAGITVNAVAPTFIRTPLTEPMLADPEFAADVRRRLPGGEVGEPEDVAAAIRFLASDAARLITGHVLAVDGGWTAW